MEQLQVQPQNLVVSQQQHGVGNGSNNPANQFVSTSLYVGDVEPSVTDGQIFELFQQIGPVISVRICRDIGMKSSLGYAYVNYNSTKTWEKLSCGSEILKALPVLQEVYGDSMHKVLHVGPDTCPVISKLLKEDDTEAWGIEPFDITSALDNSCKNLIRKGIVWVVDIKFPLPYKAQSFQLFLFQMHQTICLQNT